MMETLLALAQQTLVYAMPLLLVALGGMFSERGGVANIALDGTMILAGLVSALFISKTEQWLGSPIQLVLAILLATGMGAAFSLLLSLAAVRLRADQMLSGMALNLLAPALALYLAYTVQAGAVEGLVFSRSFQIEKVPLLGDIPILGPILFQNAYATTYLGLVIVPTAAFALYRTRFGLHLRACGEAPQAAYASGIPVRKVRMQGVLLSGALCGLGGLAFVMATANALDATTAGYGFLALAVLFSGRWKPLRILLSALILGLINALAATHTELSFLAQLAIPGDIYQLIPYAVALVILAIGARHARPPRALSQPYPPHQ